MGPSSNKVWWHTIPLLRSCVISSCKLCELTLLSIKNKESDKLEHGKLLCLKRFGPKSRGCMICDC